jgi:hypothetical protein
MSDEAPTPPVLYNGAPDALAAWNVRIIFGSITLGFCWFIILALLWRGTSGNSLHSDALSWSFALIAATLLGFGVGGVIEPLLKAFKK